MQVVCGELLTIKSQKNKNLARFVKLEWKVQLATREYARERKTIKNAELIKNIKAFSMFLVHPFIMRYALRLLVIIPFM
jgi:hypothetical protein